MTATGATRTTGATDAQIEAARQSLLKTWEEKGVGPVDVLDRLLATEQIDYAAPHLCPPDHRLIGPDVVAAMLHVLDIMEFELQPERPRSELSYLIREAIR